MSDTDDIGYAEAMTELDSILNALEDADLDIDVLASQVDRASHLIKVCRDRINGARLSVEQIVATLDAPRGRDQTVDPNADAQAEASDGS